jgi:hypothetical protein
MTQVIRVNSDYKIQTTNTGTITLDSQLVVVTGNLNVLGDTTSIEVNNLSIEDRVITVNRGELGAGITPDDGEDAQGYAGIEVDRGSLNKVAILFNEADDAWEFVEKTTTGFTLANSKIKVKTVSTDATEDGGNLRLIGDHVGVVTVPNLESSNSYLQQILNRSDDNDVPNKAYVDYAIENADPPSVIGSDDTLIRAQDKDVISDAVSASVITVSVDDSETVKFFVNRTEFHNFEISNNVILNPVTAQNIVLATSGTGKVQVNYGLQLDQLAIVTDLDIPNPVAGASLIYGRSPGVADSGIYFVNEFKKDELISKNKALVFSMLF